MTHKLNEGWVEIALDIAQQAHLGQKRRSDNSPYITHPVRVYSITKRFKYSRLAQVVAVLHDAIEDAKDKAFVANQIQRRLPKALEYVTSLSHVKGTDYTSYVTSLNDTSLQVKLCDMLHNLLDNPRQSQKEKYKKAIEALALTHGGKPDVIHQDHWEILLRQIGTSPESVFSDLRENNESILLRQYVRLFIEAKMLPEADERFDLRSAAQTLTEPLTRFILEAIEKEDNKLHSNFEICLQSEGSSIQIEWKNGKSHGSLDEELTGNVFSRLDSIGRYDIDATVRLGETNNVDADYVWDEDPYGDLDGDDVDEVDLGGIELTLELTQDTAQTINELPELMRKTRGVFAHELQHVIQKAIYGKSIDVMSKENIDRHAKDPDEVDARVEEILAASLNELSTNTVDDFKAELICHIHSYLTRNGIQENSEKYKKLKRNMIDSHLVRYREKFELWG